MEELFTSGRIVDVIVALMAVEAIALSLLRQKAGRGPTRLEIAASLAAGLALLVALRFALTGTHWEWVAAALAASLVAHLTDMRLRWTRTGPSGSPRNVHEGTG